MNRLITPLCFKPLCLTSVLLTASADPDPGGAVSAAAGATERHGLHQPRGQPAGPDCHGGRHQRRHRETTGLPALLTPLPPGLPACLPAQAEGRSWGGVGGEGRGLCGGGMEGRS